MSDTFWMAYNKETKRIFFYPADGPLKDAQLCFFTVLDPSDDANARAIAILEAE